MGRAILAGVGGAAAFPGPLAAALVTHLGARTCDALANVTDLEDRLVALVAAGRARWPGVRVDEAAFLGRIARRLDGEQDPGAALEHLHAGDLWLATACTVGDRAALTHFERQFLAEVPAAVSRHAPTADVVDEVLQALRSKLLVGGDGRPRIADYSGRGPLGAWLRVAAVREALSLRRAKKAGHRDLGAVPEPASPGTNPETALARGQRRRALKAAVQAALGELDSEERELLRLYALEGRTVEQIGEHLGVVASTASRRIARARATVREATRRALARRLGGGRAELESLVRDVGSELDVSFQRILGTPDD
jgi:RNA polymerase sigma-70 factor, ECF subfamily